MNNGISILEGCSATDTVDYRFSPGSIITHTHTHTTHTHHTHTLPPHCPHTPHSLTTVTTLATFTTTSLPHQCHHLLTHHHHYSLHVHTFSHWNHPDSYSCNQPTGPGISEGEDATILMFGCWSTDTRTYEQYLLVDYRLAYNYVIATSTHYTGPSIHAGVGVTLVCLPLTTVSLKPCCTAAIIAC